MIVIKIVEKLTISPPHKKCEKPGLVSGFFAPCKSTQLKKSLLYGIVKGSLSGRRERDHI